MDYDLCKELKDAGFHQPVEPDRGQGYWYTKKSVVKRLGEKIPCVKCYKPTLSELIEALGKDFFALKVYHEPEVEWVAMTEYKAAFIEQNYRAKSPEEAVAKLWLAIHSQKLKDSKDMID